MEHRTEWDGWSDEELAGREAVLKTELRVLGRKKCSAPTGALARVYREAEQKADRELLEVRQAVRRRAQAAADAGGASRGEGAE